jgi:hypothetical protein
MGLLDHFTTEWPLVKAAPWPFAEALLAALVALTPFLWWVLSYLKSNQLANKDAQISLLQTQLNEYREKLKVGSPDEALKKLAQLEKRTARNLTDEQQRTIQSAFEFAEPSLHITILYYRECFDCADYARRIRSAFPKDADVSLADFSGGDYGDNKHELLIGVSDATKPPPLARKLAAALSKAQLPNSFVRGIPSPRGSRPVLARTDDTVQLLVLPKVN